MGSVQTIETCPKCGIDGYIEDYDYTNDLWFIWCPNCNYGLKLNFHKIGWKIVNPITRFFNTIRRMFGKEARHFTWYDFTIIPRWLTGGRFALGLFRYYIRKPAKFVEVPLDELRPMSELFDELQALIDKTSCM